MPGANRAAFNGNGFFIAATAAPAAAIIACGLGALVGSSGSEASLDDLFLALVHMTFLAIIVTLWGLIPSAVFGGLVLGVIRMLPLPATRPNLVFGIGGMVAAMLYVLTAEAVDRLKRGAAFLFAPWTLLNSEFEKAGDLWWVWLCVALGGLTAGLIYAAFVKRG